ncbi:MAG: PIN domain-containing protein [Candidatus Bathyarchaeia archaeon]
MGLIDSFAWIEYFKGSRRGANIKEYVESCEPIYTPSICLVEIKSKYLTESKDPTTRIELILERSFIVPLDAEVALLAAEIRKVFG